MCLVIFVYKYKSFEEGVVIVKVNLNVEGKGYSVFIYLNIVKNIEYVGENIEVLRFVIN